MWYLIENKKKKKFKIWNKKKNQTEQNIITFQQGHSAGARNANWESAWGLRCSGRISAEVNYKVSSLLIL